MYVCDCLSVSLGNISLVLLGITTHSTRSNMHVPFQSDFSDHETVKLLKVETSDFIPSALWPPNSQELSPVEYTVWLLKQGKV